MSAPIQHVLIVGGGTAGWLTASLLAASQQHIPGAALRITLVESDTVGPIGVGEGTWPTMRETLRKIGISEDTLIRRASATFKQASRFTDWHRRDTGNSYYHPFSAPQGSATADITPHWLASHTHTPYADAVCFQPALCEAGVAPKSDDPTWRGPAINYGYHLDATQFIALLREHATRALGVRHIVDDVVSVNCADHGIASVVTARQGALTADLFADCSGFRSLLLDEALGTCKKDASDVLFADTALVCQQPYASPSQPVACYTGSTAQQAGWIWDIGLQHRRGVGHVYCSDFVSDDEAYHQLGRYLGVDDTAMPPTRKIRFHTAYNETPWVKNCVGIGLSAGFLEPLEASALMLIEQGATLLATQLPAHSTTLPQVAKRYNETLSHQWQSAIRFLKLHYALSNRPEAFWVENRRASTLPDTLQELLEEWQYRPPMDDDFAHRADVFSAQSYRYVFYGMQGRTCPDNLRTFADSDFASQQFSFNALLTEKLLAALPSHRALLDSLTR
ncbi:tryptophan halogenase family protein [Alteromonas halophila]|uniref:Tryptophan halogenase n=1 Tax=Alteromonas halophila TaxID=516698 RepID=A0A918JHF7_9ALTE|nr:tryptophan halogenase family protein [Alteromonas halophila]GGW81067.1 tryptophan halogenase [Alteromonas halophila]